MARAGPGVGSLRGGGGGGGGAGVSHPSALFLGAVGVAVEAGEDGAGGHQLAGLVPAARVAEAGRVPLTFHVQDGVQPDTTGTP